MPAKKSVPRKVRGKQKIPNPPPTYEGVVLHALIREFEFSDKAATDRVIKGRLRRKKLGAYDPARIDSLRALKDELYAEVCKGAKSEFFLRSGKFVEVSDWDIPRLTATMRQRHPDIPRPEVENFVPYAVFCYYVL